MSQNGTVRAIFLDKKVGTTTAAPVQIQSSPRYCLVEYAFCVCGWVELGVGVWVCGFYNSIHISRYSSPSNHNTLISNVQQPLSDYR